MIKNILFGISFFMLFLIGSGIESMQIPFVMGYIFMAICLFTMYYCTKETNNNK